ncbi:BRCT domain-containing protein [Pseudoxanthomonas daejeonensis]|uniref:NAD-dependent DNA ligase n=1 Tax=Pseudoxanthomonas daejeonensis TaxID=266062 RepID=A0ABQ6Z3E4_9GAMM|nr:BRCT domain-containing protein [Pseudoxanthomonas daejeonensis]KAF1691970.1 NAD-dependent DNA ligase [Pseudoxanthomonas daejeonensis]UNK57741.1 BRCT domain-containing protein [Pseudoxanthomonas daejeonensis]
MHPDQKRFAKFTGKARLDKSINSLLGIIEGIAIDGRINELEISYLALWLSEHREIENLHPFNELVPRVAAAMADGVLDQEEREDILWLCKRLRSREFYDQTTTDLQRLHAILGGIVADTRISEEELRGLSDWMEEHPHLKSCWPFDEIGSLITAVLADKKIDEKEHEMLHAFFSEFTALLDSRTITKAPIAESGPIRGLCAVDPEITFLERGFCFTGSSPRFTRPQIEELVQELGGTAHATPSKKVHYLIIGAEGNPCWAFSCYGRKVEKAVKLRKAGVRVVIVHELDFHDAVADHR